MLNNAEETFQDASHLFSTQHPWAQTIRTVVNLEAAGSTGPELLFQATSEEMVYAYQNVPYPHGTVVANDIFASGIMMSEYVSTLLLPLLMLLIIILPIAPISANLINTYSYPESTSPLSVTLISTTRRGTQWRISNQE